MWENFSAATSSQFPPLSFSARARELEGRDILYRTKVSLGPFVTGANTKVRLRILIVSVSLRLPSTLVAKGEVPARADNSDGLQEHWRPRGGWSVWSGVMATHVSGDLRSRQTTGLAMLGSVSCVKIRDGKSQDMICASVNMPGRVACRWRGGVICCNGGCSVGNYKLSTFGRGCWRWCSLRYGNVCTSSNYYSWYVAYGEAQRPVSVKCGVSQHLNV